MKVPDLSKATLFAEYGPASYYDLLLNLILFIDIIKLLYTFL